MFLKYLIYEIIRESVKTYLAVALSSAAVSEHSVAMATVEFKRVDDVTKNTTCNLSRNA